jgi:hypothetical protein
MFSISGFQGSNYSSPSSLHDSDKIYRDLDNSDYDVIKNGGQTEKEYKNRYNSTTYDDFASGSRSKFKPKDRENKNENISKGDSSHSSENSKYDFQDLSDDGHIHV